MENKTIAIIAVGSIIGIIGSIVVIMQVNQINQNIQEAWQETPEETLLRKCNNMQAYYNSYEELQELNLKCDKLVNAILN